MAKEALLELVLISVWASIQTFLCGVQTFFE